MNTATAEVRIAKTYSKEEEETRRDVGVDGLFGGDDDSAVAPHSRFGRVLESAVSSRDDQTHH